MILGSGEYTHVFQPSELGTCILCLPILPITLTIPRHSPNNRHPFFGLQSTLLPPCLFFQDVFESEVLRCKESMWFIINIRDFARLEPLGSMLLKQNHFHSPPAFSDIPRAKLCLWLMLPACWGPRGNAGKMSLQAQHQPVSQPPQRSPRAS